MEKCGCFETYCSITALKKLVSEKIGISSQITGLELYKFILENIEDKKINDIIDVYIQNLSIGMINLIDLFKPEVICFGGSFVHYKKIFFEKLETKLKQNSIMFKDNCTKLLIATNKNDAGIIGAAYIV